VADAPLAAAADTAGAAGPAGAADPEAIASWLTELGIEHSRPFTLSRTGLGQSNLTYAVEDRAGRRWILRRPPLGRLLASAHDVAREARILHALRDTDVPVPRVLGAKTDTVHEPRNRARALTPSADQIEALITRARDVAAGSGI
jgi:hypothetical protein